MFFKHLDILSPEITLYNKGLLYHSSKASIILSFISFFIIALYSIAECLSFFFHINAPKMTFFNVFAEEAGSLSVNPFSFFHFITINKDNRIPNTQEFDFESFRIIGFETYLEEYINNRNLSNFNHWLYGPCNNESYSYKFSSLINEEKINKYACIKKYYDVNYSKYIDVNEPNFRWPEIEHGTKSFSYKFYSLIIENCEDNTLNEIFGGNKKCKNLSQNEDIKNYGFINFNFIDQTVQNENQSKPIQNFLNRIENKLSKDNYCINNIYLNPLILLTNYNEIFKKNITLEYTYTLDKNDLYIKQQNREKDIYMGYYIWLSKKVNYYYREYLTLNEVISNIGGTSNVIISFFFFVNKIFNKYAIISDSKELFSATKRINRQKEIKLNNLKFQNSNTNKSINLSTKEEKKNSNFENTINLKYKNNITEENKLSSQNENINNITYIVEKDFKCEYSDIFVNKDDNNSQEKLDNKKFKLNCCIYLIYKISFGKAYKKLNLFEEFRIKVISVENLLTNYLNINNLIKIEKLNKT